MHSCILLSYLVARMQSGLTQISEQHMTECVQGSIASDGWTKLTLEEFVARGGRKAPRSGTMHLMAQSAYLCWSELAGPERELEVHRERIRLPPCFMGHNTASTLFSALQTSTPPGMQFEELAQLPLKLVVWSLGADQDNGLHAATLVQPAESMASRGGRVGSEYEAEVWFLVGPKVFVLVGLPKIERIY